MDRRRNAVEARTHSSRIGRVVFVECRKCEVELSFEFVTPGGQGFGAGEHRNLRIRCNTRFCADDTVGVLQPAFVFPTIVGFCSKLYCQMFIVINFIANVYCSKLLL